MTAYLGLKYAVLYILDLDSVKMGVRNHSMVYEPMYGWILFAAAHVPRLMLVLLRTCLHVCC